MNVLNVVEQEAQALFGYPDEKIVSDIYLVSLSYTLRALDGMDETQKKEKEESNKWLEKETLKIHDVPVFDFDNIIRKLSNGKSSCDAFFYNFCPNEGEMHYLLELKNANKKRVLAMLEDEGKDGIYNKVNDSVQMIKHQLEFGGTEEQNDIILHTHFLLVYAGKNDVPAREPIETLQKTTVLHDTRGKQRRAGRMKFDSEKKESQIYDYFGNKINKLGLAACSEDVFPGEALPRARKMEKGRGKQRAFSLLSAHDFAVIVDSDFFSDWKWGSYGTYFKKRK
jgi:hypothetical protein